jgi:DNA-binding PadR family transcriptional regulator
MVVGSSKNRRPRLVNSFPAPTFLVLRDFDIDLDIYHMIHISSMIEANVDKFIPLKTQWFHIMLSLADGEQHGYAIMQEVLDRTTGKVRLWPATLYGSLKRLIEAELIEESAERPAPELDDRRRRYYRLTDLGRRVLNAECERLQELVRAIRIKQGMVTE